MTKPLTTRQVADRWQVSENAVRQLARENKLRHWRFGGKLIRIPLDAVEEYECQNMRSAGLEESSASSGMREDVDIASRLVRLIR